MFLVLFNLFAQGNIYAGEGPLLFEVINHLFDKLIERVLGVNIRLDKQTSDKKMCKGV